MCNGNVVGKEGTTKSKKEKQGKTEEIVVFSTFSPQRFANACRYESRNKESAIVRSAARLSSMSR